MITPALTEKPRPRKVSADRKCSNEYCDDRGPYTLINGEDVQPFCEDCLKAVVGQMVLDNDQCSFFFNFENKQVDCQ